MTLVAGSRLGPYEVLSPLGAGGMGEVFLALDTRLGRQVAVKVLPAELSSDRERLARLEREARAASALNHPNIVTVHDIGASGATTYIAMEYVEGKNLREVLLGGTLPVGRALGIAAQIADGLAKAHEAGIVHRDLKPENLMITKDGFVKILDFGLAKLAPAGADTLSRSPTVTGTRTEAGTILGTVGYMSPEQARGEAVDFRSDQFSFGAVFYEMVAGKRAFPGQATADVIAAVVRDEPEPLSSVAPRLPVPASWIIERCLAKAPEERYASTRDLARDLAGLRDRASQVSGGMAPAIQPPAPIRHRGRERALWTITAVALLMAVATAVISLRGGRGGIDRPRILRVSLDIPQNPDFGILAVSPDGTRLAYVAPSDQENSLWVRPLDSLDAQELPGTKGASMPFWSPDARFLGFFADGKLKRIALTGGPPQILCDAPSGRGGTWNREGVILFAPAYTGPLAMISADQAGRPTPVTRLDHDFSHRWPHFLPDGKHFLFLKLVFDPGSGQQGQANALYAGSLGSGETRLITRDASNAAFVEPEYLVFARTGNLFAQRFDTVRLELREEPLLISRQLVSLHKRWGFAEFSASRSGLLAYKPPFASHSQLAWLDRTGREIETVGEPGFYRDIRLSLDGERIGLVRFEPETEDGDIWVYESRSQVPERFTFQPAHYQQLVWSPDGSEILFSSNAGGIQDIYRKTANGAVVPVLKDDLWKTVNDVSADGRFLVFHKQDPKTGDDLWAAPLFGEAKPFPLLQTPFEEMDARFSPDGRWLAYMSNESGRDEVYVRAFPGPGGQRLISTGGGDWPAWRRDGKELFYTSPDGRMMSAEVQTSPEFHVGVVRPLFDRKDLLAFDVSPDGRRFLVLKRAEAQRPSPVSLVINWTAQLPR